MWLQCLEDLFLVQTHEANIFKVSEILKKLIWMVRLLAVFSKKITKNIFLHFSWCFCLLRVSKIQTFYLFRCYFCWFCEGTEFKTKFAFFSKQCQKNQNHTYRIDLWKLICATFSRKRARHLRKTNFSKRYFVVLRR